MPVDPVFLVAAVTIFVATNIDNSVVLVTFFGHDGYPSRSVSADCFWSPER